MSYETLRHPIIYVRGFAMTGDDINETAADPYCGLNAGSTVFRATAAASEQACKYIFDSTVIRLEKEFEYTNDPGTSILGINVRLVHGLSTNRPSLDRETQGLAFRKRQVIVPVGTSESFRRR